MGNGIWTLTGVASAWNTSTATNLNLNAGASTIVLNNNTINAKTFAGGGKTYYNFQLTNTGTGALTISGNNTFNNLTIDTPPKAVNFTANNTQTINGIFTANGSAGALMTFRSTASPTKWTVNAASANLFLMLTLWTAPVAAWPRRLPAEQLALIAAATPVGVSNFPIMYIMLRYGQNNPGNTSRSGWRRSGDFCRRFEPGLSKI